MNINQITLPTYAELTEWLAKAAYPLHPSQVHGVVCGILCKKTSDHASSGWQELLLGSKDIEGDQSLLQTLYNATSHDLEDFLFEFEPILPDEEEDLSYRAQGLALWCQGVLTGLNLIGIPIEHREPGEVTEAINDLIEIANMDYQEVVSSEEDEAAFIELVEYVRMAMILIYQEIRSEETNAREEYGQNE